MVYLPFFCSFACEKQKEMEGVEYYQAGLLQLDFIFLGLKADT